MTRRTGSGDLRLHGGRVPHWLGARPFNLGSIAGRTWSNVSLLAGLRSLFWTNNSLIQCLGNSVIYPPQIAPPTSKGLRSYQQCPAVGSFALQ